MTNNAPSRSRNQRNLNKGKKVNGMTGTAAIMATYGNKRKNSTHK